MTEDLTVEYEDEEQETPPPPPVGDSVEALRAELERERRAKKELLTEVKTYKAAERESLKRDFPWLSDDDLKGQSPKALRAILSKAPTASAQQGASEGQEQAPETPPETPEIAAAKQFAASAPVGGTAAAPQKYTAKEMKALCTNPDGTVNAAQMDQMIKQGLLK